MPFKVIAGSFHVVGYSPDGDSVRFAPDDPQLVKSLAGARPRFNARGHVQLRIEAIDALETHYTPPSAGGSYHQPLGPARAARSALLDFLGIGGVVWDAAGAQVVAASDAVRGHILARSVEKNGRPVAFVYRGPPPVPSGTDVRLEPEGLAESWNRTALAAGHAYPTYYTGLFADLRQALTAAADGARAAGLGIHAEDVTTAGFDVSDLGGILHRHPIMPKLFRRLVEYVANFGSVDGFEAKMAEYAEPVLDLTTANFTHFDTFIEQEGTRIRLTRRPEDLVFDAMPTRPVNAFSELMPRG